VTGKGQTIAILELGGGYRRRDLRHYFRGLGLQMPQLKSVGVGIGRNAPTGHHNGPDSEVMLDIEVAAAVANGANYVVYFAPNNSRGFFRGINAAIHDTVNQPTQLGPAGGKVEQPRYAVYERGVSGCSGVGHQCIRGCGRRRG
jgi:kumamolisin